MLSGEVLARSIESRLARADLQFWSQQLALALAASASGIASKEHVEMKSKAKDKVEASLKLLGPMGRNIGVQEKEQASTAIEAFLKNQGAAAGSNGGQASPSIGRQPSAGQENRNTALRALWEVRTEAGARYEALRWGYTAALLSELRGLDGYAGGEWHAAEKSSRSRAMSGDAMTLVAGYVRNTVAAVAEEEREEFVLSCLRVAESASRGELALPSDGKKNL